MDDELFSKASENKLIVFYPLLYYYITSKQFLIAANTGSYESTYHVHRKHQIKNARLLPPPPLQLRRHYL